MIEKSAGRQAKRAVFRYEWEASFLVIIVTLAWQGTLALFRDMAESSPRTIATYVLAGALAALAGALVYFSITLKQVANALPPVVEGVQGVAEEIPPLLERVDVIVETTVPSLLEEVAAIRAQVEGIQEQLPAVLEEVAAIREGTVPEVLAEVENVRASIPPILERVASIQEQLPSILEEVEAVRGEIPGIVEQVEGIQTQIPAILAEVEAVRIAIPDYIEDANELAAEIRTAGKEAAEGAAQGFFTGILKAPVNVVSGLGNNVFGGVEVTDEMKEAFKEAMSAALAAPAEGKIVEWDEPKSGVRGELEITRLRGREGKRTVRVESRSYRGNRTFDPVEFEATEKADGTWDTKRR